MTPRFNNLKDYIKLACSLSNELALTTDIVSIISLFTLAEAERHIQWYEDWLLEKDLAALRFPG